ncbi:hypothetical protein ACFQ0K_07530 [Nocardioides caeni]|uniref:Uncharacterized protein n=1 Tax=Nocardioides caeni TaxID=574700 RepID=A0A4S8N001_9ACTN|nr:hypothetical protein [Nocardioides caeni]THV09078.1 hypothetical protein E9934_17360 [Nocardioides caeni]
MTDDATSGSTGSTPTSGGDATPPPPPPAPSDAPAPPDFSPDRTVMRPRPDAAPAAPPAEPAAPVGPAAPGSGSEEPPPAHRGAAAPEDDGGRTVVAPVRGAHAAPEGTPDPAYDPAVLGAGSGGPPSWGDDAVLDPDFPTRATKAGMTGAVVAVGTGLLGAAIVISVFRSRSGDDGELDWSNYGAGLAATAGLLLIALLGALASRRAGGRAREEVVTWPGVVGILGVAAMITVGIDKDDNWVGYLVGGVVVALSVIGYVAARRAAFMVTTILGLALIYGLLFDDLLADSIDGEHQSVVAAAVVGVFVLAVTLLGWMLPSRAVTGVVVGAMGLASYVGIMLIFVATRLLSGFFGFMAMGGGGDPFADPMPEDLGFVEADVWWVLAFAAVLTIVWGVAASITNHSGFSILAIAMPAITVPLASVALAAEHPTWWSAIVGAAGGVLLLGGLLVARLRGRSTAAQADPVSS